MSSASGQSTTPRSDNSDKEAVAPQGPRSGNHDKPAETPKSGDLESEVAAVKAENAAFRETLRRMEEQQKALLEIVDRLQRKIDGGAVANSGGTAQPATTSGTLDTTIPAVKTDATAPAADATDSSVPVSVPQTTPVEDRYRDGIVIWETGEDARVPFLLRFNNNTQVRYLNTLSSNDTFTDHLGNVREVHRRNDITVNRSMFILGGYVFDKRLRYSLTVWTSAGAASIVVAGNIGWQFNKALTITGGYTGVPGSRSLVNTFPFFTSSDRSMADNFFRPGFTQGIWANGEPVKNLYYLAFVGNGLNTLNISANKIDTNLLFSGSVWWEPLGAYAEPGKARNMYDDYFASKKVRVRIGTAFTRSREDRFSNLDQSSPENTSIYNSDGVLAFSTGAFAPGVTLEKATYKMWAVDGGLKWNGLAINAQYFSRWLNDFEADGPMPLASTFDNGYELAVSQFVIRKKLMIYGRGSQVFGQFRDSWEFAGGVKWHPLPTERFWVNGELMKVNRAPYSGAFTPYSAGMTGWTPMLQSILAF
ncbi:MAG TPA: hypothetical protein VJU84_18615 [Pyrinomonadaceae bacterium]|nr:hypothetical protein [Pyrinomonadaceae bacterium]